MQSHFYFNSRNYSNHWIALFLGGDPLDHHQHSHSLQSATNLASSLASFLSLFPSHPWHQSMCHSIQMYKNGWCWHLKGKGRRVQTSLSTPLPYNPDFFCHRNEFCIQRMLWEMKGLSVDNSCWSNPDHYHNVPSPEDDHDGRLCCLFLASLGMHEELL